MIYRLRLNAPNTESESDPELGRRGQAATLSTPERWFVGQIESRYNPILVENLPLDWTHLARHLALRPQR